MHLPARTALSVDVLDTDAPMGSDDCRLKDDITREETVFAGMLSTRSTHA